ncbi:uncharacterized protein LOC103512937 [Diaphorina citri]|uniref:Uncharacterized protein LOC103512937 n=1 Tax=Diaphorina citri TaxID=121845 RepID=A0A3Q0J0R7_DIACI|nr:uncharacterized protein LOC103512937 [Diaphorina citri]
MASTSVDCESNMARTERETVDFHLDTGDVGYLLGDELDFEIAIRNGKEIPRNLTQKRQYLRGLIKKVKEGKIRVDDTRVMFSGEDLELVGIVDELIRRGENASENLEKRKIKARLNHYVRRISTWPNDDDETNRIKTETLNKVKICLEQLQPSYSEEHSSDEHTEDIQVKPKYQGKTQNREIRLNVNTRTTDPDRSLEPPEQRRSYPVRSLGPREQSFEEEIAEERQSVASDSIMYRERRLRKDPKIYQWNLEFSGTNMAIEDFLDEIDLKRNARGLTWDDILNCCGDLFVGEAKLWYMSKRTEFQSWNHLVRELRRAYENRNFDLLLLEQILTRRQGPTESVISYIATMRIMLGRLVEPMSLEQQLRLIIKNTLPRYQEGLQFKCILTYDELEYALKSMESIHEPANHSTEPRFTRVHDNSPRYNHQSSNPAFNYQDRNLNKNYSRRNYENKHYDNRNYDHNSNKRNFQYGNNQNSYNRQSYFNNSNGNKHGFSGNYRRENFNYNNQHRNNFQGNDRREFQGQNQNWNVYNNYGNQGLKNFNRDNQNRNQTQNLRFYNQQNVEQSPNFSRQRKN